MYLLSFTFSNISLQELISPQIIPGNLERRESFYQGGDTWRQHIFNMAAMAKNAHEFQQTFNSSLEIFACGSNLFSQMEAVNDRGANTCITVPRKLDDNKKEAPSAAESDTCVKNSSAKNQKFDVCIVWDRIVCLIGNRVQLFSSQQSPEHNAIAKIAANVDVTCFVTQTGTEITEEFKKSFNNFVAFLSDVMNFISLVSNRFCFF